MRSVSFLFLLSKRAVLHDRYKKRLVYPSSQSVTPHVQDCARE